MSDAMLWRLDGTPITVDCADCKHPVASHSGRVPEGIGYMRCTECDCTGYTDRPTEASEDEAMTQEPETAIGTALSVNEGTVTIRLNEAPLPAELAAKIETGIVCDDDGRTRGMLIVRSHR